MSNNPKEKMSNYEAIFVLGMNAGNSNFQRSQYNRDKYNKALETFGVKI